MDWIYRFKNAVQAAALFLVYLVIVTPFAVGFRLFRKQNPNPNSKLLVHEKNFSKNDFEELF